MEIKELNYEIVLVNGTVKDDEGRVWVYEYEDGQIIDLYLEDDDKQLTKTLAVDADDIYDLEQEIIDTLENLS